MSSSDENLKRKSSFAEGLFDDDPVEKAAAEEPAAGRKKTTARTSIKGALPKRRPGRPRKTITELLNTEEKENPTPVEANEPEAPQPVRDKIEEDYQSRHSGSSIWGHRDRFYESIRKDQAPQSPSVEEKEDSEANQSGTSGENTENTENPTGEVSRYIPRRFRDGNRFRSRNDREDDQSENYRGSQENGRPYYHRGDQEGGSNPYYRRGSDQDGRRPYNRNYSSNYSRDDDQRQGPRRYQRYNDGYRNQGDG
ncbi:MAG: hypothetical protein Q4G69_14780, partial [Planctomycetia bacterium]|nr:hypothetical protein [Planctomycetia bacterium]